LFLVTLALLAQQWPAYHGGPANIKYVARSAITPQNVAQLRVAWRFDSGDEFPGSEMQCNPIVVDGLLYATTPKLRVVALDAGSGALKWAFDPNPPNAAPRKRRNRGVVYWRGQILFGFEHWLIRLDARTGREVGRIDLREGLGRDPQTLSVTNTTPGVIFEDKIILGHLTSEDLPAAPGDIRAFDLKTGNIAWTFRTIPAAGDFGADTWPGDARTQLGGANNWAGMALDERRGIVFVPTGSAAFDFYGANRHGDNLFANSLLALDARTGRRLWHFQFVKHDVWDRDLPTAPSLVQVRRDGRLIDAVAQITKSGHVFVFDRETGESLFPLEERRVPPSDVEGEKLALTQWLPLKPAPFARQRLTEDMVAPEMREAFRKLRSGDPFTPPSLDGTVIFPGFDGGAEWGGASFDPETRMLYINSNEMAWVLRLVPRPPNRAVASAAELYAANCASCHKLDRQGSPPEFPALTNLTRPEAEIASIIEKGSGRMPGYAQLGDAAVKALAALLVRNENATVRANASGAGLKYFHDGYNKFLDANGYPAITPPWGTLSALDLDTGEYAWRIPLGEYPSLAGKTTGSENYGGSIVTKSGLLFIAATSYDAKIRAFDKRTGKLLWRHDLPAPGNATPALYEHRGKQYLVIAAGGGKAKGVQSGGSYVAFALP
jgi:quinoprotein glucose dehydrogenase